MADMNLENLSQRTDSKGKRAADENVSIIVAHLFSNVLFVLVVRKRITGGVKLSIIGRLIIFDPTFIC